MVVTRCRTSLEPATFKFASWIFIRRHCPWAGYGTNTVRDRLRSSQCRHSQSYPDSISGFSTRTLSTWDRLACHYENVWGPKAARQSPTTTPLRASRKEERRSTNELSNKCPSKSRAVSRSQTLNLVSVGWCGRSQSRRGRLDARVRPSTLES